ncbi:hypothetical protein IS481_05680 [Caldimonas thermodepolymerans]|jgi:hypothetical protein|uniref:Uncharacterized protein n=1 Tax=Caldimonas thermodepolymerans TaxID=215580 RepID=A0A2S5T4E1_9BURK|nr:hypothetical protein [Caldimonas thermodepolymerans]PPE69816.1 hypothetical protein C1702_10055 [Caldimonas thermodepolymerans]QPC32649.1 hypothetical protein IS481_05680 [Caldimonas thermodepolymerans]RDI03403.1 hypothetical protein DES46_10183 [Caldimonas thermodepolymerans]TCP06738.1 hypothetical protein EV676_106223 [Caldimonas thermodepolymerans]UZG45455.1 hypothetical protein ONZ46_05745 [Caldimonas thermodepolymerans]
MTKQKWLAVVICVLLTAAAYIGSTGLFYTTFRPIRNYDLVAFAGSWAGLIWYLIRDRNIK